MDSAAPRNLLFENIQYLVQETEHGVWRRFVYPDGKRFAEFKTHLRWGDLPLVHYTYGICPETGKRITARGAIAIGRFARGFLAIGQVSLGLVAIGQASIGLVFGIGQATFGAFCLGQVAVGLIFGAGQVATGQIAIGQFAFGTYVLAQMGLGQHVIDARGIDPAAKHFFLGLIGK